MKIHFSAPLLLILISTNVSAGINANKGLYVGGELQEILTQISQKGTPLMSAIEMSLTPGIKGRPSIGYRFSDYFALESGYNSVLNIKHDAYSIWGPDKITEYAIDFESKLILPFRSGISLYGKFGGAFTHQHIFNQPRIDSPVFVDSTFNGIMPLVGGGVSYNFTQKLALNFSETYFIPSKSIDAINIVGVGLTYTFGPNE